MAQKPGACCPTVAWCLGLLLLAIAWAQPAPLRAQGVLEVLQVGWDGTTVPGTWSPLQVRVGGSGADTTARVEVLLKVRVPQPPSGTAVEYPVAAYGQEVALPAGVTKEVTLWLPTESNMSGVVRLQAGGAVLAEQAVELRSARAPGWPLVGVLPTRPASRGTWPRSSHPTRGCRCR